jgi:hypothetical protein
LASIWKEIESRRTIAAQARDHESPDDNVENAAIWKAVCSGDFSQKHRLTKLSPEAAQCLATWTGKDLFLNGLTELSEEAARRLAEWPGDWLGLNGLAHLSAETARHLSRWRGKGLSLNGLSRLSPQVAAILSAWQGEQIELINLKHGVHWDHPATRLLLCETVKRGRHAAGE